MSRTGVILDPITLTVTILLLESGKTDPLKSHSLNRKSKPYHGVTGACAEAHYQGGSVMNRNSRRKSSLDASNVAALPSK